MPRYVGSVPYRRDSPRGEGGIPQLERWAQPRAPPYPIACPPAPARPVCPAACHSRRGDGPRAEAQAGFRGEARQSRRGPGGTGRSGIRARYPPAGARPSTRLARCVGTVAAPAAARLRLVLRRSERATLRNPGGRGRQRDTRFNALARQSPELSGAAVVQPCEDSVPAADRSPALFVERCPDRESALGASTRISRQCGALSDGRAATSARPVPVRGPCLQPR